MVTSQVKSRGRRRPRHTAPLFSDQIRIHPQPTIILRLCDQAGLHRILPNVLAFLLQALIRPQDMIKRFLLPNRTRGMKELVNPMSRSALQTLQDVHEGEGIAIPIAQRRKQQMNVIRHDDNCMKVNSRRWWWCGAGARVRDWPKATLPQTVFEHKIASAIRQDQARTSTESDEQRRIGLLQVREATAIAVSGRQWHFGGHRTCAAGALAGHG